MSSLVLDIHAPAKEILLAEINKQNNTNLTINDFDFSIPEVLSTISSSFNSRIVLIPRVGSGYFGTRHINYNRLDLNILFSNNVPVSILPGNATKLSEIIPQINEAYGIDLKTGDYFEQDLPLYDPDHSASIPRVTIAAQAASFLFIGSYSLVLGNRPTVAEQAPQCLYVQTKGYDSEHFASMLTSVNDDGTNNDYFDFLRNASAIESINIDKVILLNNGEIVVNGQFKFTITDQLNPIPTNVDCQCLILRLDGSVKDTYPDPLFNINPLIKYSSNISVDFKYAIDTDNLTNTNCIYRYLQDGSLDTGYNPVAIEYTPTLIQLCDNGKLYTVSPIFTAPLATNNNIPSPQIRIDRLLATGELDIDFNPVIISANGSEQPLPVVEIQPITTNGFWLFLLPQFGVSVSSVSPVINGVALVPGGIVEAYTWNPIIRISESGERDITFKALLKNNLDKSIYNPLGSNIAVNDKVLFCTTFTAGFMTYKTNPITGYDHRQPLSFNDLGEQVLLSGNDYAEQYRWIDAKNVVIQYDYKFFSYGRLATLLTEGGYGPINNCIARYNLNGSIDRVIYKKPSTSTLGMPLTIHDVLIYTK